MADETDNRIPEFIEDQRQSALKALAAARTALLAGMVGTALTKIAMIETYLRGLAPGDAP